MLNGVKGLIEVASGRQCGSFVLKNASIVNVFTGEIRSGDIALDGGRIAGIGEYTGVEELDLKGRYVVPGLIDGHMHLESAMTMPSEFARAVLPRGTTCVVADPHEIANVCGIEGIRFMLDQTEGIGLDVYFMLPSCVPATPFDSPGARLDAVDLLQMKGAGRVLGLGELMDFYGVVQGRKDILDKLELFEDRIVDGHAPGLSGRELNACAAAGIATEHECGSVGEMLEKLRLGFYILIREGSAAKNLAELVKGVNPANMRRCVFCTDDRHLGDITRNGHIDNNIRLAVKHGLDPVSAITMATLNAAECYGLKGRGAIAPGCIADMIIVDDLETFKINGVIKNGRLLPGVPIYSSKQIAIPEFVLNTMKPGVIKKEMLAIEMNSSIANIIGLKAGSLLTERITRQVSIRDGHFEHLCSSDPLKLAVVERHKASGRTGLALLDGFGLRGGAIASTISHDSHNLIVAGDNDGDILLAIEELSTKGGGITITSDGKVCRTLPLPVGGLMSLKTYEEVDVELEELLAIARSLGVPDDIEPFMALSFLSLTVIPELRLTDKGLFDVTENRLVEVTQ